MIFALICILQLRGLLEFLFLMIVYDNQKTLGSGQFGSVVSVKIKNTKLDRAIKIIPKSRVRD